MMQVISLVSITEFSLQFNFPMAFVKYFLLYKFLICAAICRIATLVYNKSHMYLYFELVCNISCSIPYKLEVDINLISDDYQDICGIIRMIIETKNKERYTI